MEELTLFSLKLINLQTCTQNPKYPNSRCHQPYHLYKHMSKQNIKVLYKLIMSYILKLIIKEKKWFKGCMFITFYIDSPI
jgi:hypothetical protein